MASKIELHLIVAPVFATNCCVLVADNGDALVVDPGAGVADDVIKLCADNNWTVKAVAATHGHADHTWDAGPLCSHFSVPFLINSGDRYRLDDPIGTLQPKDARPDQSVAVAIAHAVRAMGAGDYQKPETVITFGAPSESLDKPGSGADAEPSAATVSQQTSTGAKLNVGAIELTLVFAPGHTEGSTLYMGPDFVLAGDVLFAGSIGRTDLPGGDIGTMTQTLQRLATTLDPELQVIPGHGPLTTVAQELATNQYWRAALASA